MVSAAQQLTRSTMSGFKATEAKGRSLQVGSGRYNNGMRRLSSRGLLR